MTTSIRTRRNQSGQAAVLVLVAMSMFLLGAVGLAIDGSHMYAQRQMAQAAADAAAQAGILSIFNGTNTTGTHQFSTSGPFTCTASDQKTPCYYAQTVNGFNSASDTITVDFPAAADVGIPPENLSSDPVNLLRVTVQRTIDTTLIRMLGPSTTTVRASGTAAILSVMSPVPIVVIHPTLDGSFSKNGSNDIIICGGPSRSIQVNSNSSESVSISGSSGRVDLSHAGPLDSGDCTTGTGADFGNWGGPNSYPGTILLGSLPGRYVPRASPIKDPLLDMAPPSQPATAGSWVDYDDPEAEEHGCPSGLAGKCRVYSPGYYANGIQLGNSNKFFALFRPGIYYIDHGGFHLNSNSIVRMAVPPDNSDPATSTAWTQGMLIYNSPTSPVNSSQDILEITSNSGQIDGEPYPTPDCPAGGNCLVGANGGVASSAAGNYYGTLFFQNRGVATTLTHSLTGGSGLSIKGTIYLTHTAANIIADGTYQSLHLQGNSGSTTKVTGEIIVDTLSLGGTSNISMNLSALPLYRVRQVALVN